MVGLPTQTDRRDGMTVQSSLSNFEIRFIDGAHGRDVSEKAIPTNSERDRLDDVSIGSWRSHMNTVGLFVRRNRSSALSASLPVSSEPSSAGSTASL